MKRIYIIMALLVALSGLFCIDLQNFDNGEAFGSIRTKINANNDTLDVYVNENISDINTLNLETDTLFIAVDSLAVDVIELERITKTVGVIAYVNNESFTIADNTYQPVTATFTNVLLDGFTLAGNALSLDAIDSDSVFVEILGSVSLETGKNGATVTFAITKNDDLIPGSNISREFAIGAVGSMSGICGTWLSEGDEISIVAKSSIADNTVTLVNIRTSMKAIKWSD